MASSFDSASDCGSWTSGTGKSTAWAWSRTLRLSVKTASESLSKPSGNAGPVRLAGERSMCTTGSVRLVVTSGSRAGLAQLAGSTGSRFEYFKQTSILNLQPDPDWKVFSASMIVFGNQIRIDRTLILISLPDRDSNFLTRLWFKNFHQASIWNLKSDPDRKLPGRLWFRIFNRTLIANISFSDRFLTGNTKYAQVNFSR